MTHPTNTSDMTITLKETKAIGYIRVSTEKQGEEGEGLERQAEAIRNWCRKKGMQLLSIHQDIASAVDAHSYEKRSGLSEAHRQALRENAIMVVYEPTRLFRNIDAAQEFLENLPVGVFSIRNNRYLGKPGLTSAILRGAEAAKNIAAGTQHALQDLKDSQKKSLGSPKGLDKSRVAALKSRKLRAQDVVEAVAAVLERDAAYQDLSNRALADLLNREGILTGWNRPWTRDAVKKTRKKAEEHIRERNALEAELDAEEAVKQPLPAEPALPSDEARPELEEVEPDQAELEKNPNFGIF